MVLGDAWPHGMSNDHSNEQTFQRVAPIEQEGRNYVLQILNDPSISSFCVMGKAPMATVYRILIDDFDIDSDLLLPWESLTWGQGQFLEVAGRFLYLAILPNCGMCVYGSDETRVDYTSLCTFALKEALNFHHPSNPWRSNVPPKFASTSIKFPLIWDIHAKPSEETLGEKALSVIKASKKISNRGDPEKLSVQITQKATWPEGDASFVPYFELSKDRSVHELRLSRHMM